MEVLQSVYKEGTAGLGYHHFVTPKGLPMWQNGKESAYRRFKRRRSHPWVGKIPWCRKWQPTPVFLPGKFHGQTSLVGYSPWSHKESDTHISTEWINRPRQSSSVVADTTKKQGPTHACLRVELHTTFYDILQSKKKKKTKSNQNLSKPIDVSIWK